MPLRPASVLFTALPMFASSTRPDLPFKPSAVPGGVVVVPVGTSEAAPEVRYHGERVLLRHTAQGWIAIVGVKLSAKPGEEHLEVNGRSVSFAIHDKRYPEQRLTGLNPHHVNPDKDDEARIAREEALIKPAWKAWPEGLTASLALQQPTPGRRTASFGMKRILNGEARSPHAGLDISAPAGQAVRAPAEGVVVLTGNFFFSGNAVFIAHGEGVVSLVCHLSKIEVKEGDHVKSGQVVGRVGSTGRSTAPHLHWSLSLNDARVDPRLFLH
jgi:murein DD-endopeptidase MepM/ murein hydrolase activator NlpD